MVVEEEKLLVGHYSLPWGFLMAGCTGFVMGLWLAVRILSFALRFILRTHVGRKGAGIFPLILLHSLSWFID